MSAMTIADCSRAKTYQIFCTKGSKICIPSIHSKKFCAEKYLLRLVIDTLVIRYIFKNILTRTSCPIIIKILLRNVSIDEHSNEKFERVI